MLGRPELDFIARFPRPFEKDSFENLFRAYPRFVNVGYDATTGISTLTVQAFRPGEAAAVANALLDGGERVVNRLNDRAAQDAVDEGKRQIAEAENSVASAEQALTDFRNREELIDPQRSSIVGLDLIGKLESDLDTLRAQRAALAASAPESPQLPVFDAQIRGFETQVEDERTQMAGQNSSLARQIGEYETLSVERDFAAKELTEATGAFEVARIQERRKRLYLERVVAPNTPDEARLPRRLFSTSMVFLTCLLIYGTVMLVSAGLREQVQS
jgi:BexC/CtrB/KpsE family polysaccharide export inner-membrane protein